MKCPHCGKEIANDSAFCEYCGEQVIPLPQKVSSTLVAWIMFLLIICASAAEMACIDCIEHQKMEYSEYVKEFVVQNSLGLIGLTNISVFVISIVLGIKKQFRKSTSIALCLMSAFMAFGAIACAIETYCYDSCISIASDYLFVSIFFVAIIAGVYGIYWLIAKAKHISF